MNFGVTPITPGDLLGRLEDWIKTRAGLPADSVFLSVASETYHLNNPPGDKFITIHATNFPVWQSVVSGAGAAFVSTSTVTNLGFDVRIRVGIYTRLNSDQELRASQLIRNDALGVLGTAINLVGAIQFWTAPTDSDPTISYLREPMRVVDGPRIQNREYNKTQWALVSTEWEMKFTAKLSTAP